MRIDQATIPIRARSPFEIVDLAIALFRTDLRVILSLMIPFALAGAWIVSWLSRETGVALPWAIVSVWLLSAFPGSLIVLAEGQRVFGAALRGWSLIRTRGRDILVASFRVLLTRVLLGALCYMLLLDKRLSPLSVLATIIAFFLTRRSIAVREVFLLEGLRSQNARMRLRHFRRGRNGSLLTNRWYTTTFFFCAAGAVLFLSVDSVSHQFFDFPILFGRLEPSPEPGEYLVYLLFRDRTVGMTLAVLLWLLYPIARIALFLAYLDARIRHEGWDLELDFRIEAARIGGAS